MTLAILGGPKAVTRTIRPYRSVGAAEREAVAKVIDDNCLSGFYGSWGDEFLGGPRVKEFEAIWAARFNCKHVVSVNSATSGLFAAVGAVGVGPGDEVIVPPYTMSATVMAPLIYGGIPVFADIEPETFCLDVESVRANISPRTKAIIAVNLFGHPARLHELRALADAHGIKLIEDNAQGPLASENGVLAGTIAHIGIFSLNYHKHIHTGEGGMCCTNDDVLAQKMQMIRNHAENIVEPVGMDDISNMVGFNYRLTELSAAVGIVQLANIESHVGKRQHLARRLSGELSDLEGFTVPKVRAGCEHVYYVWTAKADEDVLGVPREAFVRALQAEGVSLGQGYIRPLYMLPVFQKRIAFGRDGWPFSLSNRIYHWGLCPVAEDMHRKRTLLFEPCAVDADDEDIDQLVAAFRKVHKHRHDLRKLAAE